MIRIDHFCSLAPLRLEHGVQIGYEEMAQLKQAAKTVPKLQWNLSRLIFFFESGGYLIDLIP